MIDEQNKNDVMGCIRIISEMKCRDLLFEFNDEDTRNLFKYTMSAPLDDLKRYGYITDHTIHCDEFNNTEEVRDRNEFVASIYVKFDDNTFRTLSLIIVRTGVNFQEIHGTMPAETA